MFNLACLNNHYAARHNRRHRHLRCLRWHRRKGK